MISRVVRKPADANKTRQRPSLASISDRGMCCLATCCWLWFALTVPIVGAGEIDAAAPLLSRFCTDCHGVDSLEAHLNLEQLAAQPDFATQFGAWEKVIERLKDGAMPPADALQPTEDERQTLIASIGAGLEDYINQHAGDPGRVVMRRLTSAEYAYSIEDLAGLELIDPHDFMNDAVGGAGFTNAGEAQFIEDAALERYLEAAKKVAAHAVIGAGPLTFDIDPGMTGRELSAIRRIQEIYRSHGFRTAAGEGGEPFGLDLYPKAFYIAWRYQHRNSLGRPEAALADLARENGLEPRFAEYIDSVLSAPSHAFPTSEVVAQWRELPSPDGASDDAIRQACGQVYDRLHYWQHLLASASSDEEEAPVLADGNVELASERSFKATLDWPDDAQSATFEISVLPVAKSDAKPLVVWRNPRLRFRRDRKWTRYEPLRRVLSAKSADELQFGRHPAGAKIDDNDFALASIEKLVLEFAVPAGATSAQLIVNAKLDVEYGEECVVRCTISDGANPGETAASTGVYSALLADPGGEAYRWLKPGIEEFARKLPEISHREPAPSDRDPIPAPFDGTYNSAERNHFHAKLKYHRDDRFLVQYLLDDATRRRLDQAWADLLTSFDYYDEFYRVVARKYQLPADLRVSDFDAAWIASLPAESRAFVERLHDDYVAAERALAAAEPEHVAQALQFAARAWRRPLSHDEENRLRAFYARLRQEDEMQHEPALRLLLARILVAPAFLYRYESPPPSPAEAPLSDWELASRLSYFLWSSIPDDELRQAAASGRLHDPEALADQARRMLGDPKAQRFAAEFFGQWFGFYRFDKYRGIDGVRFPEFNDSLKQAMYDEAVSFFTYIVREDRPPGEMLFADYAFVNAQLARHYGLPANDLERPAKVDATGPYHRGGLLRLGAVLTITSAPLRTSPVKRGDWILRRVLGMPVPPPPADAGSIAADDVQADGLTLRQRLDAHRRHATCANCHARIDPLGFALENYDNIGRWRERYRDERPIDTSGVLSDGTEISGSSGLLGYLKEHEQQFHRTLSARLLGYALGRAELASDRPLLNEMAGELKQGGKFSDSVARVVSSKQFRYQRGAELANATVSSRPGEEP